MKQVTTPPRKKPDISMSMLLALKRGTENKWGTIFANSSTCKTLIERGLAWRAVPNDRVCIISHAGLLLIAQQFDVLKAALTEGRTIGRGG